MLGERVSVATGTPKVRVSTFIVSAVLALATANALSAQSTENTSTGQAVGQTYVLDTSGDWDIRCVRAPEGQQDNCTMFQLLRQANGNPIAEISVAPLPAGGDAVTGATLITPLGTLLQRGLLISVDGAEAKTYPFSYCTNVGCFARAGAQGKAQTHHHRWQLESV